MIPGLGSDAAVWQPTIDELAPDVECRVGDTFSDDSLPAMAARILDGAPARFALAGVSMGGMIALEIMRAAPDRVTRLFLCDTNARPDTAEQIARRRTTNAAMLGATDLTTLAAPGIAYMIHPDADQSVREALMQMTLRVGAAAYVRQNDAVVARDDLGPVLASISVPTMVVVGANDLMTPVIFSQEISGAIQGATLHIIPNCGHLPPIEKPRAVAELMCDWLRSA
jgi:pimeloyl-ACP methyl ester carboxylesterase